MDFYESLGFLVLGSRLRRIGDYFIGEVNKVYQQQGIDFEASWFPVFYLLSQREPISIKEISETLQVSHSAASQLLGNLKKRQLVEAAASDEDGRRQLIRLTANGRAMLAKVEPVWEAITHTFDKLLHNVGDTAFLLTGIHAVEQAFVQQKLAERITESITNKQAT